MGSGSRPGWGGMSGTPRSASISKDERRAAAQYVAMRLSPAGECISCSIIRIERLGQQERGIRGRARGPLRVVSAGSPTLLSSPRDTGST